MEGINGVCVDDADPKCTIPSSMSIRSSGITGKYAPCHTSGNMRLNRASQAGFNIDM